jgi:prepilin-type N-terminal cleavage/methylation domain-containing protein
MRIFLNHSRVEFLARSADLQSAYRAKTETRMTHGSSLDVGCSMLDVRCSRAQGKAFTLIEVIISVALMAIILASAYACFDAGIRGKKMVEPRVEIFQNARVAMALMTADLRDACPLSKDFDFLGTHRTVGDMPVDNLDFATHNYTPTEERQADFCETSYYLNQDATNGTFTLFRRRNPIIAPDPLSGGSQEEIATGLRGAQFEYFDGSDWYDTWGDEKGKKQTSNKD